MKYFLSLISLLFAVSRLSATYIFFNTGQLKEEQKEELFNLAMQVEPPRVFYRSEPIDLEETCQELFPSVRFEWITPTAWQIAALHAFFNDTNIRQGILTCGGFGLSPLVFDEELQERLSSFEKLEQVADFFDAKSQSLPNARELFFRVNEAIAALYERGGRCETAMARLALSELPPFDQWRAKGFPFWNSPWIYNRNSVVFFYNALMDEELIAAILQIEQTAHERGEWVLYRGYSGSGFPTTLELQGAGNHALSFGSTLLGGALFSLEASALTYAYPHIDHGEWSFLALSVTPNELQNLFRVGPLHPFLQLLVDGEMFHAHTKVAAPHPGAYLALPVHGYFMGCNRHCHDPSGYILSLDTQPEELEAAFQALCQKSGRVFVHGLESLPE